MNLQKANFGGGCFWCTEAIFQMLKGVVTVTPGYTGGHTANPAYIEICNGTTGHAEVINIIFDADLISFEELLLVFFKTHNPTLLNRQGTDKGTQYRSVIYYYNDKQKQQTELMINQLTDEKIFDQPIVTEVKPASVFYEAENHHRNYFLNNALKPYCAVVIQPKINKFAKEFVEKIKPALLH